MSTIIVNGAELNAPQLPETWGQLLETLDRELHPSGDIVTAVRFDGVEEPAFRDPSVIGRDLAAEGRIEIDAGAPGTLVERCLGEAAETLDALCDACVDVADAFRGHDIADANRELVQLADGLRMLMAIVGGAGLALRIDLQSMQCDGKPVAAMAAELSRFLESLIDAQTASDWIAVADVIQYDVEPALRRWSGVFDAFATTTA